MTSDLYSLALSVPWQITAEALEAMLSIAQRDPLPEDEVKRRMHGPRSLALRNGERRKDSGRITMHGSVALIPIDGPIYRYADIFTQASGGVTTESLARDFQSALEASDVGAILFAIDSPGGEVTGINELSDAIYAARGRKPIAAYVEGYGASAAYRIASAADCIVIDDDALLGSIGTVIAVPDPTKRPSYRIEFVSRQSPKKRPDVTTEAGRQVIQELVDRLTEVFIQKTARNRGITEDAILAIEGGLLIGQDAIGAGLADQLGSEEQTIHMLARGGLTIPNLLRTKRTFALSGARARATQEGFTMPPIDSKGFWSGFWGGAKDAGIVPEAAAEPALPAPPAQAVTPSAPAAPQQRAEPDPEIARLRQELAKVKAEQIQKDAAAFASAELSQLRAFPAEQAAIVALYSRLAEVDAAHPPQGDGQPSCVALLQAAYSARPAHSLNKPLIPSVPQASGTVLANAGNADDAEIAAAQASAQRYAAQRNGKK
jgi:ClpP class serine protease